MDEAAEFGASLTIQTVKLFSQSMLDALRRASDKKRTLAELRTLSGDLDVIVERVSPTFDSWEPGTFGHVSCNHGLEPSETRQLVSDGIAALLSWFGCFAARRGTHYDTAEQQLQRFAELDNLLFWTSRYGQQLRTMVEDPSGLRLALPSFKIVTDHYNRFLTDYEELHAKLVRTLRIPEECRRLTFPRL
jgi:hypothetical protein